MIGELEVFQKQGIVKVENLKQAADIIVTVMEGMEFHAHFLSRGQPFEKFATYAKQLVTSMLRNETVSSNFDDLVKFNNPF